MKIGDEIMVHGFVDEIRHDTVIIRNAGGYFGTAASEVMPAVVRCRECRWYQPLDSTRPYDCPKGLEVNADDFCSYGERKE